MAQPPLLKRWFPHTQFPLILSAPMLGASNGALAAQVSVAGGLGIIPGAFDLSPSSAQLNNLDAQLTTARSILQTPPTERLQCGVGFITCHSTFSQFVQTALPILMKHNVAACWLFAPDPPASGESSHAAAVRALKEKGIRVFVQVGNVKAAREAVQDGADVLVAQGIDAGGHQFKRGAGVVSLVPEVRAMLEKMGKTEVAVVAAGGIVDGAGIASVLALGAEGAVMGTRFLVADESSTPEWQKKRLLEATDGATTTVKTPFWDDLHNMKLWPEPYDGRALVNPSYWDHVMGKSLEDNIVQYKAAQDAGETARRITWCGTGVGLVNKAMPAGDIVKETREAARERIRQLQSLF